MKARLTRLWRPLSDERGLALPMVIGMMVVFSISVTSVVMYSGSQQNAADVQKKNQYANAAAEQALATAISVLATNTVDPLALTALPNCPTTVTLSPEPPRATATYCGNLSGNSWTIKATGAAKVNKVPGETEIKKTTTKTITQVATVSAFYLTGLGPLWDRIYAYDDSKCVEFKKMQVYVPVVTRGCLKLSGSGATPSRILGPSVAVGGKVELKAGDSIGTPGAYIPRADIAGTCKVDGSSEHFPCSQADNVYATTITTAPDFARPPVDYAAAYLSAKPGPMQACTYGSLGTGMKFDKNTTFNKDGDSEQLTPSGVSYDCEVWSTPPRSGTMLGEISWDAVAQVFTVNGTVFFDGDIKITAPGHSRACDKHDAGPYCDKSFSYNGRGALYTSKRFELEAGLCSGGDGSNDCETNPGNWDPAQNLLIIFAGGLHNLGDESFKMDKDEAVFQGAVYANGKCKVNKKSSVSAPLICGQLAIKEDDTIDDPTVTPWPRSLISRTGQVWPNPAGGTVNIILGPQQGG